MDKALARMGLARASRVSYFAAIRPIDAGKFTSIGARGVYESQKQILCEAVEADESILILEDDCDFVSGAETFGILENWDIFYGGHNAAQPNDLQNNDIIGAHMMGFSRLGAKAVSAYLEQLRNDGYIRR